MTAIHSSSSTYDYRLIRQFVGMALLWGLIGSLSGIYMIVGLRWPTLLPELQALSFGRLVPAHGLLMLYGFVVNLLFGIAYFVVQRTAQVRLANGFYSLVTLWGLQLVVVLGGAASLLGLGGGGQPLDLPWPLDLLLSLVWLAWIRQMFATLGQRARAPVFISLWFFIAFAVVTAAVMLLSSASLPLALTAVAAYPLFGGLLDQLLQQWQWHTLSYCLLVGTFTGAYYYVLPRQLGIPLYSQALAITNFWALLLVSVWVGGGYLHWTALPDWVGGVGAGFSVLMLVAVSAGPLNAYLSVNGRVLAAAKDPVIGFLLVATLFLLLFTLVGSLFASRAVAAWALDMGWRGIQLHSLGLGWTAMLGFAAVYHLVPRVWGAGISRPAWVRVHLWVALLGIACYLLGQWIGGLEQARAWAAMDEYGNLAHGFAETLASYHYSSLLRVIGAGGFLLGLVLMALNLWLTSVGALRQQRELDRILAARSGLSAGEVR